MAVKRIFAGTIVALLLAVTSMAAACDLSCAFAMAASDCHSTESTAVPPASATAMVGMDMGAMDVSGIAMADMSDGNALPSGRAMSRSKSTHPSIGDMGPCERQSCDKGPFVFVRAGRSTVRPAQAALPLSQFSSAAAWLPIFRDARDDVAPRSSLQGSALNFVLRI